MILLGLVKFFSLVLTRDRVIVSVALNPVPHPHPLPSILAKEQSSEVSLNSPTARDRLILTSSFIQGCWRGFCLFVCLLFWFWSFVVLGGYTLIRLVLCHLNLRWYVLIAMKALKNWFVFKSQRSIKCKADPTSGVKMVGQSGDHLLALYPGFKGHTHRCYVSLNVTNMTTGDEDKLVTVKRHQNVDPGTCCSSLRRVPLTVPQCRLRGLKFFTLCDTQFFGFIKKSKIVTVGVNHSSMFLVLLHCCRCAFVCIYIHI